MKKNTKNQETKTPATKKIAINFADIEIKDLNGSVYNDQLPTLAENLANAIYCATKSIEAHEAAKVLHKRQSVDITESDLVDVIMIVKASQIYAPWILSNVVDYLNEKLNQLKK